MPRPPGLATAWLVAPLLLARTMPAAAHPAVAGPAVVEPGDQAGGRPGPRPADNDPDSSRESGPVVSIAPVSEFIEALSPASTPFETTAALCLLALATIA